MLKREMLQLNFVHTRFIAIYLKRCFRNELFDIINRKVNE